MKKNKIIASILAIALVMSLFTPMAFASNDIAGHWAEADIKEMTAAGIISGYPDGSFKPEGKITRAEFASLVVNGLKLTGTGGKVFSDTNGHWAQNVIAVANLHGIVSGYNDTTFGPNDQVTREQMALMLVKAANLTSAGNSNTFTDNAKISSWAKDAVAIANSHGIINGYPDKSFKPQGNATRAEAAVVVNKTLKLVVIESDKVDYNAISKAGTYGPATGSETINGNVVVKAQGVTLQNLNIKGTLTIAEEVGNGDVTLNNVKVAGKTYVNGGGKDSIHINGGEYNEIIIVKTVSGGVRIVATDATGMKIVVAETAKGDEIILNGKIESVTVKADGVKIVTQGETTIAEIKVDSGLTDVKLDLSADTKVAEVVADSKIAVTGEGKIDKASGTQAGNSTFETKPEAVTPSTGGGGGGGGGGSSTPAKPTVATVVITAKVNGVEIGETVANDAEVAVTMETETEEAEIFYTLDGSNPTATEENEYSAFIVKTEEADGQTVVVKAIATKAGMNPSVVATLAINFELSLLTAAVGVINNADDEAAIATLFAAEEDNVADVLGLNIAEGSDYDLLSEPGKAIVRTALVGQNFPSALAVKAAFDRAAADQLLEEQALAAVNAAENAQQMYDAIEVDYKEVFIGEGLIDKENSGFRRLSGPGKMLVFEAMAVKDDYATVTEVVNAFNTAVVDQLGIEALADFNNAADANAIGAAIAAYADIVELDNLPEFPIYDLFTLEGKDAVHTAMVLEEEASYDDNAAIQTAFTAAVKAGVAAEATAAVEALFVDIDADELELAAAVDQDMINNAETLVTALEDGEPKDTLQGHIVTAQYLLDVKLATAAVDALFNGEELAADVDQDQINAVSALVEALTDDEDGVTTKANLQARIVVAETLYKAAKLQEATDAVDALFVDPEAEVAALELAATVDEDQINAASTLVEALPAEEESKAALQGKITKAEELLEIRQADASINAALANVVDIELAFGTNVTDVNIIAKLPVVDGIKYTAAKKDETENTWIITVADTAEKGTAQDKEIEVTVAAPTPISELSFEAVADLQEGNANVANEAVVGTLSVTGGEGAITYTLVDGDDNDHNDKFTIAGADVKAAVDLTANVYKFRVKAADEQGSEKEMAFQIEVALPAQSGAPALTAGTPATFDTELTVGEGNLGTQTNLTYTWYRSEDNTYDEETDTELETGPTYTPVADDIGNFLIVVATSTDATGTGEVVTEAVVAKAAGPEAIDENYAGTFSEDDATLINLKDLAVSADGLEVAVAIDGSNYADYADLVVDGEGKAEISGLVGVNSSTKVKVRVKETATHLAGAEKEITVTEE